MNNHENFCKKLGNGFYTRHDYTDKDREAAEEAKIPFIYATYGFGAVEKYNNKIDNIYDLLTILKIKNTKNEF